MFNHKLRAASFSSESVYFIQTVKTHDAVVDMRGAGVAAGHRGPQILGHRDSPPLLVHHGGVLIRAVRLQVQGTALLGNVDICRWAVELQAAQAQCLDARSMCKREKARQDPMAYVVLVRQRRPHADGDLCTEQHLVPTCWNEEDARRGGIRVVPPSSEPTIFFAGQEVRQRFEHVATLKLSLGALDRAIALS